MPAAPLIQLIAVGQADEYFTANPIMSYFKYAYRKHTRFAMDSLKINFDSMSPTLSENNITCRLKIPRNGDLLSDLHLIMTFPAVYSDKTSDLRFRWISHYATLLIKRADLYIGSFGRAIDTLYGEWMLIWNELTMTSDKKNSYDYLTGNVASMLNPRLTNSVLNLGRNMSLSYFYYPYSTKGSGEAPSIPEIRVAVPLNFYFTRNPMLYIPLCALQINEIYVIIETENVENLYQVFDKTTERYISPSYYNSIYKKNVKIDDFVETKDLKSYMECQYVYLDEDERRMISLNKMNDLFLVEHVYHTSAEFSDQVFNIDLNIATPIKEIIWTLKREDYKDYNNIFSYNASNDREILNFARILWNRSNERVEEKDSVYFNKIHPYQRHTCVPQQGIYVYSFALNPEKIQPSGMFNPSSKYPVQQTLQIGVNQYSDVSGYILNVYVINYNILHIIGGEAGFKFAET